MAEPKSEPEADATEKLKPSLSKPAAWRLWRWFSAGYLIAMLVVRLTAVGDYATKLAGYPSTLPLLTPVALFAMHNLIVFGCIWLGPLVGWAMVIRQGRSDTKRLGACIFFAALLFCLTAGVLLSLLLPYCKLQTVLRNGG
ncbi:MAG: hypothetical protein ACREJ2_13450 [Planctomycetota bacterium]